MSCLSAVIKWPQITNLMIKRDKKKEEKRGKEEKENRGLPIGTLPNLLGM